MASNEIIDDDDDQEFDWEAAVREIDIACHTTNPNPKPSSTSTSTSLVETNNNNTHKIQERPTSCRQSTLDQFIIGKPPLVPKLPPLEKDNINIDGGHDESFIHIDAHTANTWIYPVNVNVPLREYQLSITRTALFSNTLVALPTGLGKTFIAAVVMYNYFRWFPQGKIVFAAPSRPLVMQQIEACHNIVGIPQEWTVDMTGQTTPARRACLWKTKRVFFVTPQVLERDIQSGTCLVKSIVCLVIDEAHRALGNYSYCVAVREVMAVPVQLRLLALTATPGSKQQTIQHIIDNLQISTLEYRSESDPDVSPYVHDRKIELIEVPMGRDAVEVNDLLLEVIHPFVARLCALGVLQNRDFQTLSPCDLLNSREKFRKAPPVDLPQLKYGEVEGYFGVLMTLYHIRKLLSSHGIRSAFEMLEEKSQQGSFARLTCRNELIWKAKFIMQKSLSHGAPSPKLSKMLEVLVDHFKMRDPQNSRVIIFSNFRGSVRDIMEALANIGEFVKATQFIGQSSGKAQKGQTQKVQQAVLKKFRAGGYNVIVATSIGEEGLDIMEVDLVICFDANISPLRMIQRMGRTGRKHDGRVVVLACEGSELKGYMRKQASSNSIKKHMRNGGMNSFNFHSSPRMIPHIYKPEVQLVELSIEQFVPHGGKVKDDHPTQIPLAKTKLSDAETDLVAKYFLPTRENTWRPSLIAFPHFQAFPSRVQKLMHSFRTGMLIETMLCLQGLSFCRDSSFVEDETSSDLCLRVESVEHHDNGTKDVQSLHKLPEVHSPRGESHSDVSPEISRTLEKNGVPGFRGQNPPIHSYLFWSDSVSIDALGRVLVVSVPLLPLKEVSHSRPGSAVLVKNCLDQDCLQQDSLGDDKQRPTQMKAVSDLTAPTCSESKNLLTSRLCSSHSWGEKAEDGAERSLHTPVFRGNFSYEGDSISEIPNFVKNKPPMLLADESSSEFRDTELSPRLSNFIKSGVVPESPINDAELLLKSSLPDQSEKTINDGRASEGDVSSSAVDYEIQTPLVGMHKTSPRVHADALPIIEESQTPLANLSNNSCSKDWLLSSGDKSESVEQEHRFRRLRKYGDLCKRRHAEGQEKNIGPMVDLAKSCAATSHVPVRHERGKKPLEDVRAFIEEEAEVSSEVAVSDDEEDEQHNVSYDNSFIDDRIDPTVGCTQAEARSDMMAIYRRSLLSQSPNERLPSCFMDLSPDSVAPKIRKSEIGSSSETMNHPNLTPQTTSESGGRNSVSIQLNAEKISSEAIPCTTKHIPRENESRMASRKRKLSFYQVGSVPAINLDQEFFFQSESAGIESFLQGQEEQIEVNIDAFDDDDDKFYAGLDLDAVEEQAAKLLRYNSELVMQKKIVIPEPTPQNLSVLRSPSFDLGI